ncbi:MAG: AI-2E family transporter [Candidatus Nanosalina sp.]
MAEENLKSQRETILVTVLLGLGSLVILFPFLDALVLAGVVAYLLKVGHDRINTRIENELFSSAIMISSVVLGVSLMVYVFINNFFEILSQFNAFAGSLQQGVLNIVDFLNLSEQFQRNLESFISRVSDRFTSGMISIFTSVPSLLIDVAIFLVTTLFLYKDREIIESQIKGLIRGIPEPEKSIVKSLIHSIDEIFRGVFLTQLIVALILAVINGVGFLIIEQFTSNIPFIPLWSLLIGVAALLPLFAGFMIYGPIGIYYIMVGDPLKGTFILAFGIVVINVVSELFVRPYVGSRQMDEHPLVIFLGFLTGPLVLGLKGLIIGPLLLILTKEFTLNYSNMAYGQGPDSHSVDTEN